MRIFTFLLFLTFSLLIPVFSATAQWSNDPYENTLVSYQAFEPQMVSDGAGGAIIVWWSSSDYGLHAQRLDKYGYARWDSGGVFVGGIGWYQTEYFSLCEDGNGGCVVSFTDIYTEPPSSFARIYTQRIDSLGNKLWGDSGIPVCDIDSIGVGGSHIVSDGLGGFFVIWSDQRGPLRVYSQHLNGSGNGTWVDNGIFISSNSNFGNEYSALVPAGPGYCIAFWDHLVQPGEMRLVGQRIDINSVPHWGSEGIILPETISAGSQVILDNDNGVILTGRTSSGPWIYNLNSQRVDSTGIFHWGDEGILVCDSVSTGPITTIHNNCNFFYGWCKGYTPSYVFIQLVDEGGNLIWDPEGIQISSIGTSSAYPVLSNSSLGEIIVCWYEQLNENLVAQKFNTNAEALWISGSITFSFNTDRFDNLQSISDLSGGSILCWTRYPAILFAQQISSYGNLGEVLAVHEEIHAYIPTKITILPNYPNPFNESTVIPILVPSGISNIPIDIKIYNVMGQITYSFDSQHVMPGIHYLFWGGTDNKYIAVSSGLYIVTIESATFSESIRLVKLK